MRDVFIKTMLPLASKKLQQRYIVHGTKDKYALPNELIEDAWSTIERILSRQMFSVLFSTAELSCLAAMLKTFEQEGPKVFDQTASNEDLIQNNAAWAAIRMKAKECLDVFDVNLAEWEEKMEIED